MTRFSEHTGLSRKGIKALSLFLMPSIQALFLYRVSRYCYLKGWMIPARLLFTLNLMVYGTDITPATKIGSHFYMPHTVGVTLFGILGNRCTCYAQAAVGGGSGNDAKDLGAGPGLPVIGNDCLIGARAMIVGPIRIGDGSLIGANAFVTSDLGPQSTVLAPSHSMASQPAPDSPA